MDENVRRAQEAIAAQEYWYHCIELAPGVWTPGQRDTVAMLAQVGMPEDLTGMRVLDIGARDGFFTFEAERRGAREVVALDNVPPHRTGFARAAEVLGSKATFVTENVYSLDPETLGRFDLVLFLGVIYHLRHPLLALDRIYDVCEPGGLMLLETHMIDEGLVDPEGNFHRLADFHPSLPSFPIAQYFPGATLANDITSQWAPSKVGLEAWMRAAGFDVVSSWMEGSRGGGTGRRRELDQANERAFDEAASWNMSAGTVEQSTSLRN